MEKRISRIENRIRAQSAMEYLTTYGWAILIIGVVLAVLAEMNLFNPNTYVQSICDLPANLFCKSFFLSTSGVLTVTIENTMQDPINVTAIGCSQNKTITNMQTPYNPPSNQIYMPTGGSHTFNINCMGASGLALGQLYTGYLVINYTDDVTLFSQTVLGKVILKTVEASTTSSTITASTLTTTSTSTSTTLTTTSTSTTTSTTSSTSTTTSTTSSTSTTSTTSTSTSTSITTTIGFAIGYVANSPQMNKSSTYSFPAFNSVGTSNVVLVVAVFGNAKITGSQYTVSDTAGLTWKNEIAPNPNYQEFDMYYAVAPSGVTNDVVKVTPSGSGSPYWITLLTEVDGASGVWDPGTPGFNAGFNPSPSVTTSNANDIVMVFTIDIAGGTTTASYSNGYTVAEDDTQGASQVGNYAGIAYKVVSSAGNQSCTITYSNGNAYDYAYIMGLH